MNPAIFDRPSGAGALLGPGDIATPTAGYSLRYLSINYFGQPVVRVRKDVVGSPEQDFTPSQIIDGTLATFLGANDGFVSKWYNQFGSNDVTQTTASAQPKIWDASTGLVTDNGKPALVFDGTDDYLENTNITTSGDDTTIFVATLNNITVQSTFSDSVTGANNAHFNGVIPSPPTDFGVFWGIPITQRIYGTVNTNQNLHFLVQSSVQQYGSLNGVVSNFIAGTENYNGFRIGQARSEVGANLNGNIQEMILYDSDQSANRTKIENNINAYYDIY